MRFLAILIGVLLFAQGVFGLANPPGFAAFVGGMQVPPALYISTLYRVIVGLVLIAAASTSRAPWTQRVLGLLVTVGGAAAPLIGDTFAQPVLRWWAEGGDTIVRLWAMLGITLGSFVLYANLPVRGAKKSAAPSETK